MRRLLDVLGTISTLREDSRCLGAAAEDGHKADGSPLVRKGREEDAGSSGLVGLTVVPSSITLQSSWRPLAGT